jgi:hypothetical protein
VAGSPRTVHEVSESLKGGALVDTGDVERTERWGMMATPISA